MLRRDTALTQRQPAHPFV